MKKRFFIPACALAAAAVGFVMYALAHPELSFPWSVRITHLLYGLYADAVVLLFALAFLQKPIGLHVLTLLLELGAVFFLVQSILNVFPEGQSNWYLPLALGLNCAALFLNAAKRRGREWKAKPERNRRIAIGCGLTAAVCFGIVSYGHFYRGRTGPGWIFAFLAASQLALAWQNFRAIRKD